MQEKLEVTFEYAGQVFTDDVPPKQQIESAWHKALAHFNIRPEDATNLGLFFSGNQLDRSQSFGDAGIPSGATLRIQPVTQGTG